MKPFTSHVSAIKYLRDEYAGRKLTYREVAEILEEHCGESVYKSEAWNAEHRLYRCPAKIRTALVNMGLLSSRKRWRFFYEVNEEEYQEIQRFLKVHGFKSFGEFMRINARIGVWD